MPHRPKAIIIQFPRTKKQETPAESDVFTELKSALEGSAPPDSAVFTSGEQDTRARTPAQTELQEPMVINGDRNQVIHVNGTINNTYLVARPSKPTVIVQTGVGVIDAQQKRQLLDLRDELVATSELHKTPKTPASVMLALNKHMNVNTYSEILSGDFDKAQKYLMKQRAIQAGMDSAPQKLPEWRNLRIKAIHSRCKEKGFEAWRLTYMKKKFEKNSMIELPDVDLEVLYRAVMAKE